MRNDSFPPPPPPTPKKMYLFLPIEQTQMDDTNYFFLRKYHLFIVLTLQKLLRGAASWFLYSRIDDGDDDDADGDDDDDEDDGDDDDGDDDDADDGYGTEEVQKRPG